MKPGSGAVARWKAELSERSRAHLDKTVERIVETKERGGKVAVVTGSGPNLHEGVTTLIAEMIRKGLIDGVITSSAVVAHEMAGTLDRVKRVRLEDPAKVGVDPGLLPRGSIFEITILNPAQRMAMEREMPIGWDLYDQLAEMPGAVIIKAAGNMAWPGGPRADAIARQAEVLARQSVTTVEHIAGLGADEHTMIGAGARAGVPVLVSVPQLVGGGDVGLAVGDAISITRRCHLIAKMLEEASVIIESALALAQEIHDGPFELYTGHGIWAAWAKRPVYSLREKVLTRIDLDPNLESVWLKERAGGDVQEAINRGLPKTKLTGTPFRMEMSGFARLEGSLPVTGDIGKVWPIIALEVAERLKVDLELISSPQETPEGQELRQWIADEVSCVNECAMRERAGSLKG